MSNKRNAALEALSAGTAKEALAAVPTAVGEGTENVVPLKSAKPNKAVAKVMIYMPPKVARKFKEIAFTEDRKANDVYLEALDLYLTQQGHGGLKGVTSR
jgi:hypothetical protein